MRSSTLATLLVSVSVLLSACSSTKLDVPVEDRTGKTTQTDNARSVNTVTATDPADLIDPQGVLAKRSVYFDFDSYVIKPEGQPVVQAHAKYLTSHKDRKIVIQGNTDERGGREYNLALGQKRAEAVRKAMTLLGVADSQMEAVSFGKEKPKATGSDEASWAENRRADIVYQ